MECLHPVIQSYPWGSRTALAELSGQPSPTKKPWAEMWFGAHPLASSSVGDQLLREVISQDPERELGSAANLAGGTLPFLLKLLAADAPLSLQAHPTLEQARDGYARENEEGIATTAPHRNYRDANHKPELIVALTEFHALAGFRPIEQTRAIFAALSVPELDHYLGLLDGPDPVDCLRALFTTLLTLPQPVLDDLVSATQRACQRYMEQEVVDPQVKLVAETTIALAEQYSGDPGVLGAMLLNRIVLQPGQALYLGAGQLHAYIRGLGVEIMANSDNVLRGGLTSKHVDVVELLRVLSFEPLVDPIVQAKDCGDSWFTYHTPAREFQLLSRELAPGESVDLPVAGAAIALAVKGEFSLNCGDGGNTATIFSGQGAWISASDGAPRTLTAGEDKASVYVATVV